MWYGKTAWTIVALCGLSVPAQALSLGEKDEEAAAEWVVAQPPSPAPARATNPELEAPRETPRAPEPEIDIDFFEEISRDEGLMPLPSLDAPMGSHVDSVFSEGWGGNGLLFGTGGLSIDLK